MKEREIIGDDENFEEKVNEIEKKLNKLEKRIEAIEKTIMSGNLKKGDASNDFEEFDCYVLEDKVKVITVDSHRRLRCKYACDAYIVVGKVSSYRCSKLPIKGGFFGGKQECKLWHDLGYKDEE